MGIFPSSSLLIAIPDLTDVMVVSIPAPGNTSNLIHRCSPNSTHTLLDRDLAELDLDMHRLPATRWLPEAQSISTRLPSTLVLSRLLLLPETATSSSTEVVSSIRPPAQPKLTTPSLWSVMVMKVVRTTGSLETPGAPAGVMEATSSSLPMKVTVFAAARITPTLLIPTESSRLTNFKTMIFKIQIKSNM